MKAKRPKHGHAPALSWAENMQDVSGIRVTIVGNRALVENHAGLISFDDSHIRLRAQKGEVVIEGRHLSLSDVRIDQMIVQGKIEMLHLPGDTQEGGGNR